MKKKRLLRLLTLILVVLLFYVYVSYFNGKIIYFTTGFKNNELMKCEGNTTYAFEARILMSDAKNEYEEMFGQAIWQEKISDATFDDYIKDQVKTKLMRVQAMNVLAKERGVVLGREEKLNVKNAAETYMNSLTDNEIKALGLDKDKLVKMFSEFAIADKLYDDITSGMNIEVSSDEARVITIQYIVSDSKEEIDEAYKKILSGSSFFAIAKETNEDEEYEYELKRGVLDSKFEEVAYNLSTGQMSEVFQVGERYYIVRCTSDNDKTKTEVNKSAIIEQRKLDKFNEMFEKYESLVYIEFNDKLWMEMSVAECNKYPVSFSDIFNKCGG